MNGKRRLLSTLHVLLAAALLIATESQANNLCPYDASGDYTYDAQRDPTYLFFGDGAITYDGSIPWYMDDTMACYNVYTTPGYYRYFPKCDPNNDGVVDIGEVYDIYYRVHPVLQMDTVAQSACVEGFQQSPFFFCHPSRYNRTVADIDHIVNAYPATEAIEDPSALSEGHVPEGYLFNQLECTTPGVFPPGTFDVANACYLGQSDCAGACSTVRIDFQNEIDIFNAQGEYSAAAQSYGGTCNLVPSGAGGYDAPGFHYYKYNDNQDWLWDVRTTAQCAGGVCDCDIQYQLMTYNDSPGVITLLGEINNSTASCTDSRFGVPCPDADGDGVCDVDDGCPSDPNKSSPGQCGCSNPETGDSDGDGVVDCVDGCPTDGNKVDPGTCGCGMPDIDSDGDSVPDCNDICPGFDDNIDSDGDGIPDGCETSGDCTGPNVVADTANSLCWQDPEHTATLDHASAAGYCGGLVLDGYDDWRLPTISEIRTIIQNCPTQETGGACGITDSCLEAASCGSACTWCPTGGDYLDDSLSAIDPSQRLWSSSVDPSTGAIHIVEFFTAYIRSVESTVDKDVRCVRGFSGGCPDDDDDGVCNADDQCPGYDDTIDTNGNGIPDGCEVPNGTVVEDFEADPATWPWAPWESPAALGWSAVDPAAAHDGAQGLNISEWHYRTDVSFGAVENEMISMWCYNGAAQGCRLGFGADATGRFEFRVLAFANQLVLADSHGEADPWSAGGIPNGIVAETFLSTDIGDAWYKMDVHVGAGGAIDAQLWAEDGTPIGSVQYDFGAFPATGIAILGGTEEYVDTIVMGPSSGICIDIDQDGSCDADDLCRGDDTTGDDDGDGICNDLDICWGIDLLGDTDGDGFCDEYVCPSNVPAYYDVTTSTSDWVASGTCAETHFGVGGIPVCQQAEWQEHATAVADIIAAYPFTQVGADQQMWRRTPYMILCSGFAGSPDNAPMFDDLHDCYHGNSDWNSNYSTAFVNFDWGVNAHELAAVYGQRAAQFGGICETDFDNTPDEYLAGFRVDLSQSSGTWRLWDVKAYSEYDFGTGDYACRAHLRVWTDSNQPGMVSEDSLVNYTTGICTDSRFFF